MTYEHSIHFYGTNSQNNQISEQPGMLQQFLKKKKSSIFLFCYYYYYYWIFLFLKKTVKWKAFPFYRVSVCFLLSSKLLLNINKYNMLYTTVLVQYNLTPPSMVIDAAAFAANYAK